MSDIVVVSSSAVGGVDSRILTLVSTKVTVTSPIVVASEINSPLEVFTDQSIEIESAVVSQFWGLNALTTK